VTERAITRHSAVSGLLGLPAAVVIQTASIADIAMLVGGLRRILVALVRERGSRGGRIRRLWRASVIVLGRMAFFGRHWPVLGDKHGIWCLLTG
jgi:hypothetical protein